MATPLPSRQCVFASPNFFYPQTLILPAATPLGAEQGGPDPILPACLLGPWCPPGAEGVSTLGICPQGGTETGRGREFKVAGQGNVEALSHVTLNLHQRQRKECWAGGPWGPALAVTGGPFCVAQCLTSGGGDLTEDTRSLQVCPPSPHPRSRAPSRHQWPPTDLSTHAGLRAARGGCEALQGPGESSRDPGRMLASLAEATAAASTGWPPRGLSEPSQPGGRPFIPPALRGFLFR